MSALFQSFLDTNPTEDISLVGYFPNNDYEAMNMDNYRRASLMDKGPEEIFMPSDDLGRDARAYMSREALRLRYEPREEVRRGEIDLNDYDHDFRPGEDRNVILMEARADMKKRLIGTEYFKRDSAHQVPVGRTAPNVENEMAYASMVGATRLRQDFYMEREDIVPGKNILHGISKARLGYNPKACLAADKAMKGYARELEATTRSQFRKKVKVLDKLFGGFNGAVFDESLEGALRQGGKKAAKVARGMDKGEATFNDVTTDDLRKTFSHLRQKANNLRATKMSEDTFGEATAIVTSARRASAKDRGADRRFASESAFEDASESLVKKVHAGMDRLDYFKRHVAEGADFEEEMEGGIRAAARESRKLSSFYHTAHASEIAFEDDGQETILRGQRKSVDKDGHKKTLLEDDEMGSEDEGHVQKRAHRFDLAATRRTSIDDTFNDATEDMARRGPRADKRRNDEFVKYAVEKVDSIENINEHRGRIANLSSRQRYDGGDEEGGMSRG